jgi:hypothetical protein
MSTTITIGTRICFDGAMWEVAEMAAAGVVLRDALGSLRQVSLSHLYSQVFSLCQVTFEDGLDSRRAVPQGEEFVGDPHGLARDAVRIDGGS